ncbi:MAG TPA: TlpA disulfide reductase family protein [Acidimicrobiales bacterium]|nr:TlpA disulfide reductase family protein [Acidimicrobiales bacterium]
MRPSFSVPRDRRFWTIIIAGFVVAAVASFGVASFLSDGATPSASPSAERSPLDLTPAEPSESLASSEVIGFDDQTRTFAEAIDPEIPTVVNFFASTCTPCRLEMPAFEEVSQELEGKVAFLGLAVQDRPEDALALVADTGVTYEVARDRDGAVLAAVGGFVMPTTAFVAPDGTVLAVHLGELTADELRTTIDELFA